MPIRLRPRPGLHVVSRDLLCLVTGADGFVKASPDQGFFAHETRMLSRYRWRVEGHRMEPIALAAEGAHTWLGYYACEAPGNTRTIGGDGTGMMQPLSEYTLELRLRRTLAAEMLEEVVLTNFTQQPTAFRLVLELDADFADLAETHGERKQHGTCEVAWDEAACAVTCAYRAAHSYAHRGEEGTARIARQVTIHVQTADTLPLFEKQAQGARLSFDVEIPPRGTWKARLAWTPQTEPLALLSGVPPRTSEASFEAWDARDRAFADKATGFETAESVTLAPTVVATLRQAQRDLGSLRLHSLDGREGGWTVAAGVPLYLALYGRDTLTAAWQAALLGPDLLRGTLPVVAHFQGTSVVDWRDEQPGRMPHELHTGPLKALGYTPAGRSYGSVTTSAFFPVAVSELWHWTGERDLAYRFLDPALKALRWLDTYGLDEGHGFYAYATRSAQGVRHQTWKDSPDALVDADGNPVTPPVATCEEQAFVYQAKCVFAETLWHLGNKHEAARLLEEAGALKKRFNEAFWIENEGFYALGLDAQGAPVRTVTSNPIHCLATAIVPPDRAARVAERLFQPDLFSGWGVRTLSTENPAFNPYSYHRGSVWPVEQDTLALALMRYGLWDALHTLCRAQFDAAALFEHFRLPETFGGHARSAEQPFPALYPQANSPQAWSASSVFCLVQALLGLYPYAPLGLLVVDPHLPAWLPELTLRNVRVGGARATIRFYRKADGTSSYHIEAIEGTLHVLRQPSPWSLTATTGERLADALASLLPGK